MLPDSTRLHQNSMLHNSKLYTYNTMIYYYVILHNIKWHKMIIMAMKVI